MKNLTLNKIHIFLLIFLLAQNAFASTLSEKFPAGRGSKFVLAMKDGTKANLVISIASSSKDRIGVEFFISISEGIVFVKLWQHFILEVPENGHLKLVEGYVNAPEFDLPQKLTGEYLKGFDGIQMSNFLFVSENDMEGIKVGDEVVILPAGKTKATHYRKNNRGQTVDFWIAEEAKPIGLVKLISKSDTKKEQNYSITLTSLMKNVRPTINPDEAIALDEKGRSLFVSSIAKR